MEGEIPLIKLNRPTNKLINEMVPFRGAITFQREMAAAIDHRC